MSGLQKLSEDSLTRPPEEVFDIICKLGEGSYGSVYKALHKESGQVLAIKQVPVESELGEIIKEISIMQQCDSSYVVRYYGSYFKGSDLWIVMEYCGGGSVSDIMKLRKKVLNEEEIATILRDTLSGLEYLHAKKKIHRDCKCANILLNNEGVAKLADFGVAGQLTDTMAKRNTIIGTPFWMAPEVIQEIGYDCLADIWSLGIVCVEMAESKPPYHDIHPMRAIFMIPTKPPPTFKNPEEWSTEFRDFVSKCLVKNPENRATASELLGHDFIKKKAKSKEIIIKMIQEANLAAENEQKQQQQLENDEIKDDNSNCSSTVVPSTYTSLEKQQTKQSSRTAPNLKSNSNSKIQLNDKSEINQSTIVSDVESDLGTLIINNETDDDSEKTLRPSFMQHFDRKHKNQSNNYRTINDNDDLNFGNTMEINNDESTRPLSNLNDQNEYNSEYNSEYNTFQENQDISQTESQYSNQQSQPQHQQQNIPNAVRSLLLDGNFEFLRSMTLEQLKNKMATLDQDMENEIEELNQRYAAKRQPIFDAIEQKQKKQLNF